MMTHKRHFCILPYKIHTIRISQKINNKHKRWLENKKDSHSHEHSNCTCNFT